MAADADQPDIGVNGTAVHTGSERLESPLPPRTPKADHRLYHRERHPSCPQTSRLYGIRTAFAGTDADDFLDR
jgi:hypothetical protein